MVGAESLEVGLGAVLQRKPPQEAKGHLPKTSRGLQGHVGAAGALARRTQQTTCRTSRLRSPGSGLPEPLGQASSWRSPNRVTRGAGGVRVARFLLGGMRWAGPP